MARILIIDDSVVARMSLKSCLPKNEGHEIAEGSDGTAAISLYDSFKPDVLFMDLTMPGVDGVTAMKEILGNDPSARIVILTADIQRKTIDMVMELGAVTTVRKPPVPETVVGALRQALDRGRAT